MNRPKSRMNTEQKIDTEGKNELARSLFLHHQVVLIIRTRI